MNFINPKTDFAFKNIFGSIDSKDIPISFLNALLYDGQSIIEDLDMQDLFVYPDHPLELVFVELPNFQKELAELETITDKWIYFMKQTNTLETVPESMGEVPEIQKAFRIANVANLSLEELEDLEK